MARVRSNADRVRPLEGGWRMAVTEAGACAGPAQAARLSDWIEAAAPGTAAQALKAAGRWRAAAPEPLHDKDVWWRIALPEAGRRLLQFDGLASIAEVWVDEAPLLASASMFVPAEVEAQIAPGAVLWICFRALTPHLSAKGPRARWRPAMMATQGLRRVRTTGLGHMPGWCPPVDIVGPWRAVSLVEPGAAHAADLRLQAAWDEGGARLIAELTIAGASTAPRLDCAGAGVEMTPIGNDRFRAELRPQAQPWFPHTHGDQPLYAVRVTAGGAEFDLGRIGFRTLEVDRGPDGRGFSLRVNGEPVFCRGACWITPDLLGLGGRREDYGPTLKLAREAGFNMVRISGVGVYETAAFYDLCDELGLLVWQDFMFANFDYPANDPEFAGLARREAEGLLETVGGAPSLAVLCGGSEVFQQAAMMGFAPAELAWPLFDELLPQVAAGLRPDVPYVPNTPSGGALPFTADAGVTHYYGVGAYERPLDDARRAGVRFAAECLAFANIPQPESLASFNVPPVHDPRWKAAAPRDRGASWDFEDVRDHYLARLFGEDPARLRREDPDLYLDLSRAVSGEAMAAVFAEWRRTRSPCGGGLIWTLRDLALGAGWGLIDAGGEPKPAWYAVRRVCQPVQVLLTDEGVNGLAVHLVNEGCEPLAARLRLAVFAEEPGALIDVRREIALAPRSASEVPAFDLIGRFFDLTYAYRFGPRAHACVAAQLLAADELVSQAVYLPPGVKGWACGGAVETKVEGAGDDWRLTLTAQRFQRFVHIADAGFRPQDDGFALLPGEARTVRLLRRPDAGGQAVPDGQVFAPGGRLLGCYAG